MDKLGIENIDLPIKGTITIFIKVLQKKLILFLCINSFCPNFINLNYVHVFIGLQIFDTLWFEYMLMGDLRACCWVVGCVHVFCQIYNGDGVI
jgi:hypothetical protein